MKWLWLALIVSLTFYAPMELISVIIKNEFVRHLHPDTPLWHFGFEIAVVGVGYIIAMVVVYKLLR